jgi:hypothetical protein
VLAAGHDTTYGMNALERRKAALDLKHLAALYRWAVAEYKNQSRNCVGGADLAAFRLWVVEPYRHESQDLLDRLSLN